MRGPSDLQAFHHPSATKVNTCSPEKSAPPSEQCQDLGTTKGRTVSTTFFVLYRGSSPVYIVPRHRNVAFVLLNLGNYKYDSTSRWIAAYIYTCIFSKSEYPVQYGVRDWYLERRSYSKLRVRPPTTQVTNN